MRHAIVLLPLLLAACATGGSGAGNTITVEAVSRGQQVVGANCNIINNNGNWNVVAPVALDVGPSNGDLRVICNRQGYRTSEVVFSPYTGASGSSVGVGVGGGGGHVGGGIGLSLPIGGGGYRAYPSRISVEMTPQ